ncbi:class IV lanthionine synthetase LanL [Streptomyces sp. TP-A0874]|uniref:class IV lanthionine synthetase LanL n=1 Tax=Streptomyces sp. TP-A0874 TaxID=549819 RepID=UPI001112CBCA|nr:class IV lanthionine synthetase LanL [Streptomyces sp. TP-A0874]
MVRAVLDERRAVGWGIETGDVWCQVTAPQPVRRVQGWKLHVSATRLSAPEMLYRAADVLVDGDCMFKFAKDLETVAEMTSAQYDRAQCGKFLTAYPRDDVHFRDLAAALDAATAGLPGPAVLTDRPYRPGGVVSYRYGAFDGVTVFTDDGVFEPRIRTPDGGTEPDLRQPWFCPPEWAELPLPGEPGRPAVVGKPAEVLLAGRYVVREAIRHSARGGVYRALDRRTGSTVIVKQARAHVGSGLTGEDARERQRHEVASLRKLAGLAPEVVEHVAEDGHSFLVEELVAGEPLLAWVRRRHTDPDSTGGLSVDRAVGLARSLTELLTAVHARGLVYQDLSPNNLLVTDDEQVRLVDAEWAAAPGSWTRWAYTPGFGAPEQRLRPYEGVVQGDAVDRFSLGAVLFHLATGMVPLLPADEEAERSLLERLRGLVPLLRMDRPAFAVLEPVIEGLTRHEPERRWSLDRVREHLSGPPVGPERTPGAKKARLRPNAAGDPVVRLTEGQCARAVDDGIRHLARSMADPEGPAERLWSIGDFGDRTDPCSVQHGAAGVLSLLSRASALPGHREARELAVRVAAWVAARRTAVPRLLPGLYFGRSGTAWALEEAGLALGDQGLREQAAELALSVPTRWPNPDVCHGVAGSGLTQLRFWHTTGTHRFLDRARECADALAEAADHSTGQVLWPVPPDIDSTLAGIRYLGFAHGVAGVGTFLLAAGRATGEQRYLDLAEAAGETLATEAERGPWGARWRADIGDKRGTGMLHHWCSGASGVGTFLLRLWDHTGDPAQLRLAEEAAAAVRRAVWEGGNSVCHGLAGDAHYLLDVAEAVPDGPYRAWAEEAAVVMYSRHALAGDLLLLPDDSGIGLRGDQQTGFGGQLDFLLRLVHGGTRPWMVDTSPLGAAGRKGV